MLDNIKRAEKDRIFCLHSIEHSLDTARIAYIIALEENMDIKKDVIYAAALLHDIGRYSGKAHNEASTDAVYAIMPECGYSEEETSLTADAVRQHRADGGSGLSKLLYRADKLSRNCFECKASRECYWSDEKRNKTIIY